MFLSIVVVSCFIPTYTRCPLGNCKKNVFSASCKRQQQRRRAAINMKNSFLIPALSNIDVGLFCSCTLVLFSSTFLSAGSKREIKGKIGFVGKRKASMFGFVVAIKSKAQAVQSWAIFKHAIARRGISSSVHAYEHCAMRK